MISTVTDMLTGRSTQLPDDWREMDLVQIANGQAASGFLPIRYKSRDEFFSLRDDLAQNFYTIEGRQIYFGGAPDPVNGIAYQFSYYGDVPVFSDTTPSWVYTKQNALYRYAALMHADLHAVGEEQSAANMKTLAEDMIQKLNAEHRYSKASGSRLTRRRRSFG